MCYCTYMTTNTNKARLVTYVTEAEHEKLRLEAARQRTSVAAHLRKVIGDHIALLDDEHDANNPEECRCNSCLEFPRASILERRKRREARKFIQEAFEDLGFGSVQFDVTGGLSADSEYFATYEEALRRIRAEILLNSGDQ